MGLSKVMQQAVDFANANGGKLTRYPGGFWMQEGVAVSNQSWCNRRWFGTPTVQALVTREVMFYSKWQEGKRGKFPIEASLQSEPESKSQDSAEGK